MGFGKSTSWYIINYLFIIYFKGFSMTNNILEGTNNALKEACNRRE